MSRVLRGVRAQTIRRKRRKLRGRARTSADADRELDQTVRGFMPLPKRLDGGVTRMDEGMTEWRRDDRVG